MLIPIGKNIFIDPNRVSAVEQVEDTLYVFVEGRPFVTDLDPEELFKRLETNAEPKPDRWVGR